MNLEKEGDKIAKRIRRERRGSSRGL